MRSLNTILRDSIGSALGADIVEQNIAKGLEQARESAAGVQDPVSFLADPMGFFMGREWLVKRSPQSLTFDDLRKMAGNPIIASIIQTRLNQAAAFCVPSKGSHDVGFRIVSDDETAQNDTAKVEELTQFVFHCGMERHGDNLLESLARKVLRDSLILDQMCAEVVPRRNRLPAYIVGVDGATIRRLKRSLDPFTPPNDDPYYVQVLNDRVVAQYRADQLMYGIRNPQTDVKLMGYGMSELEYLFRVVTTIFNAEKLNSSFLSQGGMNKGLLVVSKPPDRFQFEAFKRDFREAFRNASQWWRAPVLGIPEGSKVDWLRLDANQRDMEYAQLFDFLVKEACGVYQIDPSEINWSIGAAGSRTTFESRQDAKLRASQRKGLKPLLTFFANQITTAIVEPIDPRYRMEFVGVAEDRTGDAEIAKLEVTHYRTVNEVRMELGLEEIDGGDVILNDAFMKERESMTDQGILEEVDFQEGEREMFNLREEDEIPLDEDEEF